MAEGSYLVEFSAGLVYLIVSARLLWPSRAAKHAAQRILGAAFASFGFSYVVGELPYGFPPGAFTLPLLVMGRMLYDIGALLLALFAREVFQKHEAWASGLLVAIAGLLLTGALVSLHQGDVDGVAPLGSTGFWVEWVGQLLPFAWVAVGAWVHFSKARKRERIGVSGPISSRRYLLISLYGVIQLCAFFIAIPVYMIFELQRRFHPWMDGLMGALEILPCGIVWVAFFPPAALRGWLLNAGPTRAQREV